MPIHLNATAETRFWAKVIKSSHCWLWTARVDKDGYGRFRPGGQDTHDTNAARVSYVLSGRPLADGEVVRHTCDNPPCVRPDHLLVGTHADNHRDARERGRLPTGAKNGRNTRPESWAGKWPPAAERMARGEHNGAARFTADEIRAIREAFAGGESQGAISRRVGTTQSHVSRIVLRRVWRHI
jgi:hypothetical protein